MGVKGTDFSSEGSGAYSTFVKTRCAECGARFMRTRSHVYKRRKPHERFYCSYKCFRVQEKKEEAKAREKYLRSCKADELRDERNKGYQQRRRARQMFGDEFAEMTDVEVMILYAERKVEEYETKRLISVPGTNERRYARRNLTKWQKELLRLKDAAKTSTGGEQNVQQEADV